MDLKGKLSRRDMLVERRRARRRPALLGWRGCGSSSSGGGGSGSSASKTLTLGSIGWTENVAVSTLTLVMRWRPHDVQIKGPLDVGPLYQGVASGDLHAFQDVWMPNHKVYLNKPRSSPRWSS